MIIYLKWALLKLVKKNLRNNSLTKNEGLKRSKRNLKKNDIAKRKAK